MMPARNPYERRGDGGRGRDALRGFADGGAIFSDVRRSTVEFEDLEAMVGKAAARGRREAADRAYEREHMARCEAWAEGHAIGMSDGRMELRGWFAQRFDDEIHAAYRAAQEELGSLQENGRNVTKPQLAERVDRLARLLASVSMAVSDRSDGEA